MTNIINQALEKSHRDPNFHKLSVDFLKSRNYGVKVQLDGYNWQEVEEIGRLINCTAGYRLYWLYEFGDDFSITTQNACELWPIICEKNMSEADVIIEFLGCDIYFYCFECEFYLIFGARDKLALIDVDGFSDEKALKKLDDLNRISRSEYYQWLYDTYQHI